MDTPKPSSSALVGLLALMALGCASRGPAPALPPEPQRGEWVTPFLPPEVSWWEVEQVIDALGEPSERLGGAEAKAVCKTCDEVLVYGPAVGATGQADDAGRPDAPEPTLVSLESPFELEGVQDVYVRKLEWIQDGARWQASVFCPPQRSEDGSLRPAEQSEYRIFELTQIAELPATPVDRSTHPDGDDGSPVEWPAHLQPVVLHRPEPNYPSKKAAKGFWGKAELRVVVETEGRISEITTESPPSDFLDAALEAVRRWRFRPVWHRGRLITWSHKITVRFKTIEP